MTDEQIREIILVLKRIADALAEANTIATASNKGMLTG